jgi:hypothetical protein
VSVPPVGHANLWIQLTLIQGPRPQRPVDGSAEIIAVFHALHRLLAPRHPPHALSSLAALAPPSNPSLARRANKTRPAKTTPELASSRECNSPALNLPKGSTENRKNYHALNNRVAPIAENAVVLVIATFTACPNCQRTAGRPEDGQHSPFSRRPADRESLHAFECGDPRPERAQPDHLCVSPYASIGCFVNLREAAPNRQRLSRNFLFFFSAVWRWGDSNPRHPTCKAGALPLSYIPSPN